jgi:hypothetical protein
MLLDALLFLHSLVRWWVLAACLWTLAYARWARDTEDTEPTASARDQRVGKLFVASVDVQVLLGMSLWFAVSPLARLARQLWAARGFGALWAQPELRFFGVIHPALALLAALTAHASWVAARRATTPAERRRRLVLGAAASLALLLAAVPWPFLGHERPVFRLW